MIVVAEIVIPSPSLSQISDKLDRIENIVEFGELLERLNLVDGCGYNINDKSHDL